MTRTPGADHTRLGLGPERAASSLGSEIRVDNQHTPGVYVRTPGVVTPSLNLAAVPQVGEGAD